MATAQNLFLLLVIVLLSCNSPDKKSEQLTVNDTSQVSQIRQLNHDSSIYVLDTTITSNFKGDTIEQIRKTLKLVTNFEKASLSFRKDTFSVYEKTIEGCEIIVVHNSSTDFIKLYGTLYGEMGKNDFKFYVLNGRKSKLSCAVFTDISYDKPMYKNDMQIKETKTTYQIYTDNKLIALLDNQKRKQNASVEQLKATEDDTKQFFKDYIGQIKIVK